MSGFELPLKEPLIERTLPLVGIFLAQANNLANIVVYGIGAALLEVLLDVKHILSAFFLLFNGSVLWIQFLVKSNVSRTMVPFCSCSLSSVQLGVRLPRNQINVAPR